VRNHRRRRLRVIARTPTRERAIVYPFRLHTLELTSKMSTDEREH